MGAPRKLFVGSCALALLLVGLPIAHALAPGVPAIPPPAATSDPATYADLRLQRPRVLAADQAEVALAQRRIDSGGIYLELFRGSLATAEGRPPNPAHQSDCLKTSNRAREHQKARASKVLAFSLLVDRTVDRGASAARPLAAAERTAISNLLVDYLVAMCTKSRIATQTDRDLDTAKELLQYASALDVLFTIGHDFGSRRATAVGNVASLAAHFHEHYRSAEIDPQDPMKTFNSGVSIFLVNNHRAIGASAIGVAALVLAGQPEGDQLDSVEGRQRWKVWLDFALDRVDLVLRWTYSPGDGAYGESPSYWRFLSTAVVPFARAWDRAVGGRDWVTATGVHVPSLWRHPIWAAMARWGVDVTMPTGRLANFDDGNMNGSGFYGAYEPGVHGDVSPLYWQWATGEEAFTRGEDIDLGPDQILTFDDKVVPAPPDGSPTRFYIEGGNAVLRSGWDVDAIFLLVQGEHGAAREFGRERDGTGELYSASHDHADPGSFMLHAFGEQLLLDPGIVHYEWNLHRVMNKPSDHNMVLVGPRVEPESPGDPLSASIVPRPSLVAWEGVPGAPVPTDGDAQLSHSLDTPFVDGVTVTARYGRGPVGDAGVGLLVSADIRALSPYVDRAGPDSALVQRRVLLLDDRYSVIVDAATSPIERTYTWPFHGNGGGLTSRQRFVEPAQEMNRRPPLGVGEIERDVEVNPGTYEPLGDVGARWTHGAGQVSVGFAPGGSQPATWSEWIGYHEIRGKNESSHTARGARLTGKSASALSVAYPSRSTDTAPVIRRIPGGLEIAAPGHIVSVVRGPGVTVDGVSTDGGLLVVDRAVSGALRLAYAEEATELDLGGGRVLSSPTRAPLGVRLTSDHGAVEGDSTDDDGKGNGHQKGKGNGHEKGKGNGHHKDRDKQTSGEVDGAIRLEVVGGAKGDDVTVAGFGSLTTLDGACAVTKAGVVRTISGAGGRWFGLDVDADGLPRADAGADRRVTLGASVLLDGTSSCDPQGQALTPRWTVASMPPGASWRLDTTDPWRPRLLASRAGPYRMRLTVRDVEGNVSSEDEVVILAGSPVQDTIDNDLDGWFDLSDPDGDTGTVRFPI